MAPRLDTRIPAVIAGLSLNGLGVIRSLEPFGISCWILFDDGEDPCLATRFAKKIGIRDSGVDSLRHGLQQVADRTGERPVLYLTNDEQVENVSRHRDQIQPLARITMLEDGVIQSLLDKSRCQALFEQAGLDQPKTVHIGSADTPYDLGGLQMPCIVKAGVKPRGYLQEFAKAYVVNTEDEAATVISRLVKKVGAVIVQEWIDGTDEDIFFVLGEFDRNAEPLALFTGQKLGSCPPKFGTTAACIPSMTAMARIEEDTVRFFHTAGFCGIASLEFKRDHRTRRHVVIEPTVLRTDFQSEIAPLNGVNIPLIHYCFETGQAIPEPGRLRARGWYDPASVSKIPRENRQRIKALSGRIPMHNAYWSWRDPGPYLKLHGRRLTGLGRRLANLFRPSRS